MLGPCIATPSGPSRGSPGSFARSVLEAAGTPRSSTRCAAPTPTARSSTARLDELLRRRTGGCRRAYAAATGADAALRWPDAAAWQAWLAPYRGRSFVRGAVPGGRVVVLPAAARRRRVRRARPVARRRPVRADEAGRAGRASPTRGARVDPPEPQARCSWRACGATRPTWGSSWSPVPAPAGAGIAGRGRPAHLWSLLDALGLRVAWVCDNAGRELVADLLLVDRLLADDLAASVTLHLKPSPYFVSDATARDLADCLGALPGPLGRAAGERLRSAAAAGRLAVAARPLLVRAPGAAARPCRTWRPNSRRPTSWCSRAT